MIYQRFEKELADGRKLTVLPNWLTYRANTVDEETRSVHWVLSQEIPDRALIDEKGREIGDLVRAGGIVHKHFKKIGVPVLVGHNTWDLSIGRGRELRVDGDKFVGRLIFDEGPEHLMANRVWSKIVQGSADQGSIGFIALKFEKREGFEDSNRFFDPIDFIRSYLMEFSMTPTPMLQTATMRDADFSVEEAIYEMTETARVYARANDLTSTMSVDDLIHRLRSAMLADLGLSEDGATSPTSDDDPAPTDTEETERKTVEEVVADAVSRMHAN